MHHAAAWPVLLALWVGAAAADDTPADAVNALRAAAGLPPLAPSAELSEAAARHAAYLDRYHEPGAGAAGGPAGDSAHRQRSDLEGFSGETPPDRAVAAGYPHREVLENVSVGYDGLEAALEGLMSAIYHRLTFLDLKADELGWAVGETSHVFLLGRGDLREGCEAPPQEALYRRPVDCLGRVMTRASYDGLCAELPEEAWFRASHPVACRNGLRLDAEFMSGVCKRPPPFARFRGTGRYYEPCGNDTRIDADWFDRLCRQPPDSAVYDRSGRYVELCEPPRRVWAEWFEAYCAGLPDTALYRDSGRFRRPCADPHDLRVEFLDDADRRTLRRRPEIVLWPPPDARGVPPAFFIEEPDPLPDRPVAGHPVSVQVNPAHADRVTLEGFELFRLKGGERVPVESVRLLDADSDPNGLLTAHEFALFPSRRLAWGAAYEAVVDLVLDARPRRLVWRFVTKGVGVRVLTAATERQRFVVPSGEPLWLYLPPREGQPHTVLRSQVSYRRGNRVALSVIDPNTAEITVEARFCDRVTVTFEPQAFEARRVVELIPAGCPG